MRSVRRTADFERIANLPIREPIDLDHVKARLHAALGSPSLSFPLRDVQAQALHDAAVHGGAFGAIRVGGGKTLISLLAPVVMRANRPVLLCPASLVDKTEADRRRYAKDYKVAMHLRILSYEMLGRVRMAEELERYRPDLIIADEVHRLKNRKAACTRRVSRYMKEHPETRFVALSGTVMKRSIKDFAHILRWCLKDGAPVPQEEGELEEWAQALDDQTNPLVRMHPGPLAPNSLGSDIESLRSNARAWFGKRLADTPGVVIADAGKDTNASLRIVPLEYEVGPETESAFQRLRGSWETPSGYAFSEAIMLWKFARELAVGLHYMNVDRRLWEICRTKILSNVKRRHLDNEYGGSTESLLKITGSYVPNTTTAVGYVVKNLSDWTSTTTRSAEELEAFCAQNAMSLSACSEMTSLDWSALFNTCLIASGPSEIWKQTRRSWAGFVRDILSRSRTYDSELQVRQGVLFGDISDENHYLEAWEKVKNDVELSTVSVWHDDSALRACESWASGGPGIVFTGHSFFGRALAKRLGAPYYGEQGQDEQGNPIEQEKGDRVIVASVQANGTGRNLQAFNRALVTTNLNGGDQMEQLLGRLHRQGQQADEVEFTFLVGCYEHVDGFARALEGTRTLTDLTGQDYKLSYADITMPGREEFAGRREARWKKQVTVTKE